MIDRQKVSGLLCSRDHHRRFSPLQASETQQAYFELAQNLSLSSIERSCVIRIYQGFNLSLIGVSHPPRFNTSTFMERSTSRNNLRELYIGRPSCSKDWWSRSEISGKRARNDKKRKSINQWIYQNKYIFLPDNKVQ